MFTKELPTFTLVNMSNYIRNLAKHKVNLDAYWCSEASNYKFNIFSNIVQSS